MADDTTGTIVDYRGGEIMSGPPRTAWGQPAQHQHGIAYYAPWAAPGGGFPEHCRRNALALSERVPVHLRNLTPVIIGGQLAPLAYSPEFVEVEKSVRHLTDCSIANTWANVYQMVPNEGLVRSVTTHRFMPADLLNATNRAKVVYLVLERDRISNMMADDLNRLGQVWTTCYRTVNALVSSGVDPQLTRVVPLPTDHCLDLPRRPRTEPAKVPRFYHIGKWEPRKAQDVLLLAFMQAFGPGEAQLVIKTGTGFFARTAGYPKSPAEAVREALQNSRVMANGWNTSNAEKSIHVTTKRLSAKKIESLHHWGDCYVSLAYGEGWDMPAFDACQIGNLVLRTDSGGPEAFAPANRHVVVPSSGLIKADLCYRWDDACYWNYDLQDAVTGFHNAALRIQSGAHEPRVETQRQELRQKFNPDAVGREMLQYLEELRA